MRSGAQDFAPDKVLRLQVNKAIEIGKFRRARSMNPAFQRARSNQSDTFDLADGEEQDTSRVGSAGFNRSGSARSAAGIDRLESTSSRKSNRSSGSGSRWDYVKKAVVESDDLMYGSMRISDSRDSARTTRPSTRPSTRGATAVAAVSAFRSVSREVQRLRSRTTKVMPGGDFVLSIELSTVHK